MRLLERFPAVDKRLFARLRLLVVWGLITLVIHKLATCGHVDVHWKEEVLLASGQTIVVKRTAKGETLFELGGPGGWRSTVMTLEVINPKSPANPPLWSERWVPMIFDVDPDTGQWFVIATFYMCDDWAALGKPKLPYVQFRVADGRWERAPLDDRFFGRQANMLTGPSSGGEPSLITLKEKESRNIMAGEAYRHVLSVWPKSC